MYRKEDFDWEEFVRECLLKIVVFAFVALLAILLFMLACALSYPFFELGCTAINAVFDTDFQNPIELLGETVGIFIGNGNSSNPLGGYNGPKVITSPGRTILVP